MDCSRDESCYWKSQYDGSNATFTQKDSFSECQSYSFGDTNDIYNSLRGTEHESTHNGDRSATVEMVGSGTSAYYGQHRNTIHTDIGDGPTSFNFRSTTNLPDDTGSYTQTSASVIPDSASRSIMSNLLIPSRKKMIRALRKKYGYLGSMQILEIVDECGWDVEKAEEVICEIVDSEVN